MARPKVLAVGFTVGVLWLLMAATTIWSAFRGAANGREDWALAWGLVGGLLLAAGLAALAGTWWHEKHVRVRRSDHGAHTAH